MLPGRCRPQSGSPSTSSDRRTPCAARPHPCGTNSLESLEVRKNRQNRLPCHNSPFLPATLHEAGGWAQRAEKFATKARVHIANDAAGVSLFLASKQFSIVKQFTTAGGKLSLLAAACQARFAMGWAERPKPLRANENGLKSHTKRAWSHAFYSCPRHPVRRIEMRNAKIASAL